MTEEAAARSKDAVEAISIDALMQQFGIMQIDICKINIEGTEKELFEKNYEAWLSKTNAIIIELHDRMRPGCTKSFLKAMVDQPFAVYPHGSYLVCTKTQNFSANREPAKN